MHLTDLSIDGFGVLAGCRLDELGPGLNVVHGPNSSGKTTMLHFLRGVWCGFDDARRRRLLPPLAGGHPGGSIEIAQSDRRYRITRQALPNQTDRLAVTVKRGGVDDGGSIRGLIESLNPDLVHLLYAVGAAEGHALDRLVHRAARDGVELKSTRRRSTRFDDRLEGVRTRRITLLGGDGVPGETERLRSACLESATELRTLRGDAERLRNQLADRYDQVIAEVGRLESRIAWLDLEIQALQSNLIETEGATVVQPAPRVTTRSMVVECHPKDDLQQRIRNIDARISHARTVIEDLARSRMQVSVQTAQAAGTDDHDAHDAVLQQRNLLRMLEQETLHLRDAAATLEPLQRQACRCAQFESLVTQTARSLQQHLYLMCQQISRQEQALRQHQLKTERSHIDRCEAELLEHVARLQRERAQLRTESADPGLSALRHPSLLEVQTCGCREHPQFADRTTARVRVQVSPVAEEPVLVVDPRRPEWRRRLAELTAELDRTKSAWREAITLRGEWDTERSRLIVLERRMAEVEFDISQRESQLAERLEEGQSLLLVEAGLDKLRDNVFEDEPSQVIADASGYLSELTAGRYHALQVTGEGLDLFAVNDSGLPIPTSALSRGMLDQVGLSLRIALSDEYARRGLSLPLVLDEVLSDTDPERADLAIRLLQRVSERRQVLFFTCQEHLAARFEAANVLVRDFPGTRRQRTRAVTATPLAAPVVAEKVLFPNRITEQIAATTPEPVVAETSVSIHPREAHWLRVNSPVSLIPSLSEQLARRISAAGVRTIGDLIERDPEETDLPLDTLQITPADWRIWQAEGRLLTCVPQLTGRDAQMLAAVGILIPQELAEADPDTLVRKIDRLRGDGRSGWVLTGFVWPDRNVVASWIACGRRARTFREACESIGWQSRRGTSGNGRTQRSAEGRHFRVDQPSSHRGPRLRRRLGQRGRSAAFSLRAETADGETPRRSFVSERPVSTPVNSELPSSSPPDRASSSSRLRFHLDLQSPVVDAPSIGPTTARRFERIGVLTVSDLLNRDAQQLADRLQHRRITSEMVRQWQDQSRLMCRVPELRGHDVQVLVACGLTDPEAVSRLSPQSLFAIVGPFVATKEGQRLLRSAKSPDLAEVTDWISWAQQARVLKAA